MKKILFLLAMLPMFVFTSCSKDDDPKFDYPMETLYGTWEGTGINVDGKWIDPTDWLYTKFAFSIKFNSDGTYSGKGYFGNGSGTYKAEGNMIYTYISGKEYARYTVKSLSNNKAELIMSVEGSSETLELRVQKK